MISDPEYKIGRPRQLFTGSVRRNVQLFSDEKN
jgi:citrate synthase